MTESSPDLKTTEVTGHQPNCCVSLGHLPCTCTHTLAERLAVRMGTWRKEHEWTSRPNDGGGFDEVCGYCGSRAPDPGSCYPPLDDALAWRVEDDLFMVGSLCYWGGLLIPKVWVYQPPTNFAVKLGGFVTYSDVERRRAAGLLWIALKDAGLLEE